MKIFADCGHDHILMERMTPYFKKNGVIISHTSSTGCDVHLSFTHFITPTNLPKVLRLDGIYYDEATDFKARNSGINHSTEIANGIIYQSEFSKEWCYKYLSLNTHAIKDTIYNGIDPSWCPVHIDNGSFNILVVSNWRRWKRLKEITEIFLQFKTVHKNSHLHIIGNPDYRINDPDITYYGKLNQNEYKSIFHVADVSMHLAKRDWCPNSLIETLGAGVPVITTDAEGGAKEIVSNISIDFIAGGDNFSSERLFQYTDGYNKLSETTKDELLRILGSIYKDRPRIFLPNIFNIEHTANKYIEMFRSVCI